MLHSIAHFITGLVLFSVAVIPSGVIQSDEAKGTLHGTVVEAENQVPIGNAVVQVSGKETSTETDRDGSFRFNELRLGDYTLIVSADGYSEQEVQVSLQSPEEEVIIELQPAY